MIERNHKANPLDNQCRQKNDKPGRISQAWWKFRIYNLLGWDDGKGGFEVFNNLVKTEKTLTVYIKASRYWWILEKEMATHSRILAWRIPWTEEPCRLWSMGSQRVGHDWAHTHWWILLTDSSIHFLVMIILPITCLE